MTLLRRIIIGHDTHVRHNILMIITDVRLEGFSPFASSAFSVSQEGAPRMPRDPLKLLSRAAGKTRLCAKVQCPYVLILR